MKKLVYFYIVYLLFFFLLVLFYDLSAFLTVSSFPVPSFLFYTPLTREIFLGVQFVGIPLLFLFFFFVSGKDYVIGLLVGYFIVLLIFYFLPNIFIFSILSLIGLGLFVSVIPSLTSRLSKVLWGISSLYFIMIMVNAYFSLQFYPLFIIPSIIASGIEMIKLISRDCRSS